MVLSIMRTIFSLFLRENGEYIIEKKKAENFPIFEKLVSMG